MLSLLYDLACVYDLSLKTKNVISAERYVLNVAKFYFATYFTVGIP